MKKTFIKLEPRIVHYCDFKYFCNNSFKESLQEAVSQNLGVECDEIYEGFAAFCNKVLNNHVPLKKKYVRGNHSPFMNKSLSKAIMSRTRLKNIFLQNRTKENKINYNKQRNLCVTLLEISEREYYQSLCVENICHNEKFWKVVKSLLSNKIMSNENIKVVEGTKISKSDKETAKVLNNFSSSIIPNLKNPQNIEQDPKSASISDPVMRAIANYRAHPSIIAVN